MESLMTQAHCISCPAWNRIRQGLNMNKIEDLLTFFELEKMSPRLDYWTTRGNFIFLIVVSLFYSFMCEILSQIQNTESIELSSRVGPYSWMCLNFLVPHYFYVESNSMHILFYWSSPKNIYSWVKMYFKFLETH